MRTIDRVNAPRINDLPGLAAIYCNKQGVWGGIDNLAIEPKNFDFNFQIKNKDDAFERLSAWKDKFMDDGKREYVCGYVADYDKKILYYDHIDVLEFLKDPKYGQETLSYFVVTIRLSPSGNPA